MSDQLTLQEVCEKYWPEAPNFYEVESGEKYYFLPAHEEFKGPAIAKINLTKNSHPHWLPIIAATAWAWWKGRADYLKGLVVLASLSHTMRHHANIEHAEEAARAWASLIRW